MKGLKFLASCAVVGAVAAACATASFADDYTATASYDNGTVTVGIPADYVAATDGDLTLLILSEDATSITEANKGIVKQIQQGDAAALSSVAVGDLADGTYYVRIGGAEVGQDNPNGFIATTFTVGNDDTNPYASSTRLIGDVNDSKEVDIADLSALNKHVVGSEVLSGEDLQAADVNDTGEVDIADLSALNKNVVDSVGNPFAITYVGDKSNIVE